MERLHVVDGHGYIFRAHFGLMNTSSRSERKEVRLSTKEGRPTGALYVFARMLIRLLEDVRPERIAVVFDAGRRSFRSDIFPEYKANRPPAPDDLAVQMPTFRPLVEAMGWPVLAIEGVEADDVVATLASDARKRGWETVIYSADKDLMQLVGEDIAVIDAMRALTYTREAVIEKFGVPPERVADFLALRGDTSDNIPGVHGVGDKTAADLVNQYPSIEAMIAGNPKIRGKFPLSDPAQIERLRVSRKLVELDREVKLPVALDDLKARTWDRQALIDLFTELEFFLLVDKVNKTPDSVTGGGKGFHDPVIISARTGSGPASGSDSDSGSVPRARPVVDDREVREGEAEAHARHAAAHAAGAADPGVADRGRADRARAARYCIVIWVEATVTSLPLRMPTILMVYLWPLERPSSSLIVMSPSMTWPLGSTPVRVWSAAYLSPS